MIALYLDSSAIIYLIEGTTTARRFVAEHLEAAEREPMRRLLTSQLARLECRVKPLRAQDAALLATYDAFFTRPRLGLIDVNASVIDRATELRARYGFKTPDAIHLACATMAGADVFLTGDANLMRCSEIRVEIVSPAP